MRKCEKCGAQAPDIAAYCPGCGDRFPVRAAPLGSSGSNMIIIAVVVAVAGIVAVMVIGIIAAIAIPNLLTSVQRAKQKRATGEIRNISTAAQAYDLDNRRYPVTETTGGNGWSYAPLTDLKELLSPSYIKAIPEVDPWGYKYLYGFTPDGKHFAVISTGKDGQRDEEVLPESPRATNCYESDIICVDGDFIQEPEGKQRSCGGSR